MSRRCSHCGHNGHNSRTCPNRGVKLFGVRLVADRMIRKSVSMGNLSHYTASASASSCNNNPALTPEQSESAAADDGYVSDGMVQTSKSRERKKGVPWTEHEHKMFLVGLQKLGKGDWRGISRNFVTSRTPTQVASHAQKYFLRQSNLNKRKRRSSLFDLSADTVGECNTRIPEFSPAIHELALNKTLPLTSGSFFETGHSPNLAMSLGAFSVPPFAPNLVNPTYLSLRMSRPEKVEADKIAEEESKYSVRAEGSEFGGYFRPNHIIPCSFPLPLWPDLETSTTNTTRSSATSPPNIEAEESVEKSSLSLSIAPPCVDPPQQSAFHSNNMGSSSNAIRVV